MSLPFWEFVAAGVLGLVLGAAQRAVVVALYRKWFRQGFAGDAALHLAVVRELKRGRYTGIPQFLIKDEPDSYPILFHRFAALFPMRVVEIHPYLPNLVLWSLFTGIAGLYAQYVGSVLLQLDGIGFAAVFIGLFLTLASNISLDLNGLNYISLSERLTARVSCGLYFAALAVWLRYHDPVSLAVVAGAGTAAGISSMFGRQAVAFVTPVVAVILLDPRPLVGLVLAVLGSLAVDRDYFLRGIRHMVEAARVYNRHTKHSRYYRLGLSHFLDVRELLRRRVSPDWTLTQLETREPTRLLFRYPELLLLAAVWFHHGAGLADPAVAVVVATLVVYVATSTAALRHFGEANRYIEYNLCVLAPMALAAAALSGWITQDALAIYACWLLIVVLRRYQVWWRLSYPERDVLRQFIEPLRLGHEHTLFTVPFNLGSAVSARAPCRAIMYQGSEFTIVQYQKFFEEIPFLKRDWRTLAGEFGVTHIIAEKSFISSAKTLMGWEYDFSALRVLAETDRYIAYAVDARTVTMGKSAA